VSFKILLLGPDVDESWPQKISEPLLNVVDKDKWY